MRGRLRVVFVGTADFAVLPLTTLAGEPDGIVAAITRPDRPAGRGRKLRPPPVKMAARELRLPVFQPSRISTPEGIALLRSLSPDLLFVVAFGEILSPEALTVAPLGSVNLHASLLPRYRGAAPIQRALLAGEHTTGVTVQWMAAEMDAGDIILQRPLAIAPEDDYGSLHARLAQLGAQAAQEAVLLIQRGEAPRLPQPEAEATYAPMIKPAELAIDWQRTASELVRQIRAFAPRPGTRTTHAGQLLKVLAARSVLARQEGGIPGQVSEITAEGFVVNTPEGRVLALRVQPAGGRVMSAAEYVRGRHLAVGERLGAVGRVQSH